MKRSYSIHDVVKIETNSPIHIPKVFEKKVRAPDISFIQSAKFPLPKAEWWMGMTSFGGKGFIGKNLPFNIKMLCQDIEGRCKVLYTKRAFKELWLVKLFHSVLLIKLIQKGYAYLHANAVYKDDLTIALSGWMESGKTGTTIRMMQHGFRFICEDRTIADSKANILSYPGSPSYYPNWLPRKVHPYVHKFPGSVRKIIGRSKPELPEEKTKKKLDYLFIMDRTAESSVKRISTKEAIRKSLYSIEYEVVPEGHNIIKQYAYMNPGLDIKKLKKKHDSIISSAVKGVKCFKVCTPDRSKFFDMIMETVM